MFGRLALAGLTLMTMTIGSQAQDATFYTVTYVEAAPASANAALPILKAYRDAGRKDDGAMRDGLISRNRYGAAHEWSGHNGFRDQHDRRGSEEGRKRGSRVMTQSS